MEGGNAFASQESWYPPISGSMTPTTQGPRYPLDVNNLNEKVQSLFEKETAYRSELIKDLQLSLDRANTAIEVSGSSAKTEQPKEEKTPDSRTLELIFKNPLALNKPFLFKQNYQEGIRNISQHVNPSKTEETHSREKPLIVRFGMDLSSFLSSFDDEDVKDKGLHSMEKVLFCAAVKCLMSKETLSTESFQKKLLLRSDILTNNLVLVDVFERNTVTKKIDKHESGEPKTHTIVLWRVQDEIIYLIDPNKTEFTKWLTSSPTFILNNLFKELTGSALTVNAYEHPRSGILYGYGSIEEKEKVTGYSLETDKEMYRDCVDIAVKIAFELFELQIDQDLILCSQTQSFTKFSEKVLTVMGNRLMHPPQELKHTQTPMRLRQSTKPDLRKFYNQVFLMTNPTISVINKTLSEKNKTK